MIGIATNKLEDTENRQGLFNGVSPDRQLGAVGSIYKLQREGVTEMK